MARMNIILSDDLQSDLQRAIPHGLQSAVLRQSIRMCVDFVETHGDSALGFLLAGSIKLTHDPSAVQNLNTSDGPKQNAK